MADKYEVGQDVRLTRNYEFGNNIQIRKTTKGKILSIRKGSFGKKNYEVQWYGVDFPIIMNGTKDFVPAQ